MVGILPGVVEDVTAGEGPQTLSPGLLANAAGTEHGDRGREKPFSVYRSKAIDFISIYEAKIRL